MIYLDNAATTFPKPEAVYREMDRVNRTLAVNSGRGSYKLAKEATELIESTKNQLLKLFRAEGSAEICFTPSVTHAMNQVLRGARLDKDSIVYITPYEHNAVARTVFMLQKQIGFSIELIPVATDLKIDLAHMEYQFTLKAPSVVIVNKVSNVTGYVLPAEDIFKSAKRYNALTIMDAAQAAGLCAIDMGASDTDILCFAGHKTLYGPFGVGGFVIKHGIDLRSEFAGGTGSNSLSLEMPSKAPDKYEASSQNIVAIAGLSAALSDLSQKEHMSHVIEITEYLLARLGELDNVRVMGAFDAGTTLGIVSFIVENYYSDSVGEILDDEFDIAVRTGYHCAPYVHDYLGDKDYLGTVRIGVGIFTSRNDIDRLIEALEMF